MPKVATIRSPPFFCARGQLRPRQSRYNRSVVEIRLHARHGPEGPVTARIGESLLELTDRAGVPLGQSCGGTGVCGSCALRIVEGMEHLTPLALMERKDRTLDHEGGWCLARQAFALAVEGPALVLLWHPAWGLPAPATQDPLTPDPGPPQAPKSDL